jgi:DNA-binding NarL/FixJ family response regulator
MPWCEGELVAMKCLLVDDHALIRDALSMLIALHHSRVDLRQASCLADARERLVAEPDIQLVLLDLALPDSHGIATLASLREVAPTARVVVLSADERPETVLAAIDAGAAGFIPKTTESNVLRLAIATVIDGGIYIPPIAMQGAPTPTPASAGTLGLTPRQVDVLRMLVDGRSNKAIARALDLAPSTVKTHLEGIFQRLNVGSRTQAVVAAARLGLRL